jgi:hypothetical protein
MCRSVFYCGAECQRAHWQRAHRAPCKAFQARLDKDPLDLEPALFFETRRFLYEHRDESFGKVGYEQYFMEYTPQLI